MNQEIANQIILVRNTINSLEQSIKEKELEFTQKIADKKNQLLLLNNQKQLLEKQFIKMMQDENFGSFRTDTEIITHNKRISLKLINQKELQDYILQNASKLKEYVKDSVKTKDELINLVAPRTITATSVKFLSERYNDITGEVLPGMEKSITDFLTIKNV